MSATMVKQGGRVQLEQSDMHLALNMATLAKEGFLRAASEEMQQVIKKQHAEVREQKQRGVVFHRHNMVKAPIEWHPAMVQENQTDGRLLCQISTAKNPRTLRRCKGRGTPPPRPVPPRPGMPPAPPADSRRTHSSKADGMPPGYVYIHNLLSSTRFFNHDPYAGRITCAIKILIQICWLMKVHPQVCALSAVW